MLTNFSFKQEKNMNKSESTYVGLQLLTTISEEKSDNVVIKSSVKSNPSEYSCYLQICHLCKKKLRQDKDVYMYRGDLGFCSVECRNRQILMDERRELEASTKQMLASYRHCNSGAGKSETQVLVADLRRQRRRSRDTLGYSLLH